MKRNEILKGAAIGGTVNGIINGTINWFTMRGQTEIPLAQDIISSNDETVMAGIVPLATSLAFILTTVSYLTTKIPNKPKYFPRPFLWALRNTFFAFGVVVAFAIMVQRVFPDAVVTPLASAAIAAITAGIVGGVVDYMTKTQIVCD